jgi:hypothetical protein
MEKGRLRRLGLYTVAAVTLATTFSSCHLFQTAQVQFENQSNDTFSSITLGDVSVGTLTPGSTSSWYTIDSGTCPLNTVSLSTGAIAWSNSVKVDAGQSYSVIFFGSAPSLTAQITQD